VAAPSPDALTLTEAGPILLYDGECGVCNHTVGWFLAHEELGSRVRFAALESEPGRLLRSAAAVAPSVDSLLWIERKGERLIALDRSSAALRLAEETRGAWRLLAWLRVVPRCFRDFCYERFAQIRHRVVAPACFVPLPEQRARFLTP
jgi:predicted DCC family thiol-disulfide oxidoreductase YuxK